jgi:hypothetical protein
MRRIGSASLLRLLKCIGAAVVTLSCGGDDPTAPVLGAGDAYAVTLDNRILSFDRSAPGTILGEATISGLGQGERLVSVDFRPADGQLYGVGTDDRVYRIDRSTAAATTVGSAFATPLSGTHFGLAVGASDDRIRVAGVESDQNLMLNPATGALVSVDASFAFGTGDANQGFNPALAALAYANATLYGIDSGRDVLVRITTPSTGVMTTVGPLGVNTVPCAALDIATDGVGWASLADNGVSRLYTIDLSTGAATLVGVIDVDSEVQGLALSP